MVVGNGAFIRPAGRQNYSVCQRVSGRLTLLTVVRREMGAKLSLLRELPCGRWGEATIASPEQTAHAHRMCDVSTGRKSGCTSTAHDCRRPRRGDWGEARSVPRRRGQGGRWRQCAAISTPARYAQRGNQGSGRRENARAPFKQPRD